MAPAESAALDEAILEAHIAGSVHNTLHFYRRAVPTISVGYFQKIGECIDLAECQRRGVAVVRRRSGGSSIFTDAGQLIYGLVVHDADLPKDRAKSFEVVCTAISRAVSSFGLNARYRPMNDVEVAGRKVSGSAQLRRKGSVLQHGTIIVDTDLGTMDAVLKPSKKAPSKPSDRVATLASLCGSVPPMDDVKSALESELERSFGTAFERGLLSAEELGIIKRLVQERYANHSWNFKF